MSCTRLSLHMCCVPAVAANSDRDGARNPGGTAANGAEGAGSCFTVPSIYSQTALAHSAIRTTVTACNHYSVTILETLSSPLVKYGKDGTEPCSRCPSHIRLRLIHQSLTQTLVPFASQTVEALLMK